MKNIVWLTALIALAACVEAQCPKCSRRAAPSLESDQPKVLFGTSYFKHEEPVSMVRVSPDGKHLVSAEGKKIVFWDSRTGAKVRVVARMLYAVVGLEFSPDGKRMIAEDSC